MLQALVKAVRGSERPGHRYLVRKPDGKGGWTYEYAAATGVQQKLPLGGARQVDLPFDAARQEPPVQKGPDHAQDRRGAELVQKHPKEIVDFDRLERQVNAPYASPEVRARGGSRHVPAEYPDVPTGTWAREGWAGNYGHDIWHLQELDPHDPRIQTLENNVETNAEGRGDDAARYAEWMRDDALRAKAPPIRLLETDTGKFNVTDGHRRLAAAKLAGKPVRAWVSYSTETGKRAYDGKPIKTGLTHEIVLHNALLRGEKVPDNVLAAYPDLRTKMDEERKDFAPLAQIVQSAKPKRLTVAQVNAIYGQILEHLQAARPGQGSMPERKAAKDKADALLASIPEADRSKISDANLQRLTALV